MAVIDWNSTLVNDLCVSTKLKVLKMILPIVGLYNCKVLSGAFWPLANHKHDFPVAPYPYVASVM